MSPANENEAVQRPLMEYAEQIGWEVVPPEEALRLRRGESGLFFYPVLKQHLQELNPELVSAETAERIMADLESVRNSIEGNAEMLAWLRGERGIYDESESRHRNVNLIDFNFNDLSRNRFQVTEEWTFTNGQKTNRADVVFLINGVPVAVTEAKSPKRENAIEEAMIQIRRYHRETPELMTAPQLFDVTQMLEFHYGATWNLSDKNLYRWKPETGGTFEDAVKSFFDRPQFLKMLRDWILFFVKDDELQKAVLRQHQMRAVERIVARCADPARKTGLIWHTQGSGKTFTMITAAREILKSKELFSKATVILMIDRNELQGQLSGWVERLLGECQASDIKVHTAGSKSDLEHLLASDFRGLIITMIHKFDKLKANINPRDTIFILADEAHRSTGGNLGNYLMGALPNATLIGFTGTPIDKTAYGEGTFKIFGKEDDKGYLDKYSIAESISDKTTLSLKYSLAPASIRVPREQLDAEFFSMAESEGISDIDALNKILDRAVNLKNFLKAGSRIEQVAQFVAKDFRERIEPMGYKAFLVAVDREASALYKEALDKLLPPEWVVPVYTSSQNDSEKLPLVAKHQLSAEEEKKVRKLFPKADRDPKIFIVTDKLLTGFDAPVLYCMYLDKPMRDHVLLQAIARVNRPYASANEVKKPCGLVTDFVGVFENLEKALSFDFDVVSGVVENIDVLQERFCRLMDTEAKEHLPFARLSNDKAVEAAVDHYALPRDRSRFIDFFRELQDLYEILSPAEWLRPYVDDVARLSTLYQLLQNTYRKRTGHYPEMAAKTEMLVRESVEAYGVKTSMKGVEINEKTLAVWKDKSESENLRVLNLINSISKTVADRQDKEPYLKALRERADAILEKYQGRQIKAQAAIEELFELSTELATAEKVRNELGLSPSEFAVYCLLNDENVKFADALAVSVADLISRHENYRFNANELRQLKAALYKLLLPAAGKEKMFELADRLLSMELK